MEHDSSDFWNPENHPWRVGQGSPLHEWTRDEGYEDQRALVAEHVAAGGEVETAAYPDMRRYANHVFRPALEGIRQARVDAKDLMRAGLYDAESILDEVRAERAKQEQAHAQVDGGMFVVPDDLASSRLHTTVTRLFTDPVVYNVSGESYTPRFLTGHIVPLRGRLHLVAHRDIDTGIDLDGEYKVDLIDAGMGGPGVEDPVMRLLWGPESAVAGAVHCGVLRTWSRMGGLGPPGTSRQIRDRLAELGSPDELSVISVAAGTSVWCWGPVEGWFDVLLVVDDDRKPLGIILDSSPVTHFSWYEEEDGEPEVKVSEWPSAAREFSVLTDDPGINPNVPQAVQSPFL